MSRTASYASLSLLLTLAGAAPWASQAQSNTPLTGAMSGGGVAQAAPVPATAPAAAPAAQMPARPVVQQVQTPMPQPAPQAAAQPEQAREEFGDITRGLLAAQADGRRAGAALPVLGAASTAAWNRYIDSFTRPIPEWFDKRVQTNNTN
ncbi:DUF3613 domain-containing protein [Achromobacter ruhlandii]|uniref:DUF3613 domain-containing protein n=1 Tax=Achromobacter ruhlandii TaxID=72557 RepID=UPI0006653E92|nr:DUF3613 domain-containing protein [Achromobacter ruhlandii]AKP89703.1 hypothetical protein Axylo_2207 [Achromobacter xylosoxidans]AOU92557.1 uncharacterized protein AruCF_1666 [Achromobacter ruhlandii]MCZ8430926.1 DUF3613 domain-containing protein [Achromobacter ruhlandii]MDC6087723.1 DUF3613 domain-containing protein [Achromobacter ruhlandii]MDC6150396.1 DUF3613 domain-containing protein [Achromobacter ruhlandii]